MPRGIERVPGVDDGEQGLAFFGVEHGRGLRLEKFNYIE